MQQHNPAFAILDRAAQQPDAIAFVVGGHAITYRRFTELMVHFTRRMRALGITRGSTVGLAIKDAATATLAALAVALLGGRWVPASSASAAVFPGVTHVLGSGIGARQPGRIEIGKDWYDAPPFDPEALSTFPGYADPGDTWIIAHSSGTTGSPKFMPVTYAKVWRRMENPELQDGVAPTTWNLFPATSYVGLKINAGNLVLGGTNVAGAAWDELVRLGVTRVMGSPAQLSAAIFGPTPPPQTRLRSLKVTGALITRPFVETALAYFEELHVLYAATESGVATVLRLTEASQFDGSVGLPFDGAEVEVVDQRHQPVPPGGEGIVRIRTGWAVPGYIDEPSATAQFFRDGWFYPGDLGRLAPTGALYVTGRSNDVLSAGGMKLNAAELDEIIQFLPGIADGFCFMRPDRQGVEMLSAMVTLRPGVGPEALRLLRTVATARLGQSRAPRLAFVVEKLPRNDNGKPMRSAAAELAAGLTPIRLDA
jgi:acyl-coenzyme A synthetase/AMP-(fatty) acid ligase